MSNLNSETLQARALDHMARATEAAGADMTEVAERLTAHAQTHALLSIAAALREMAQAVREN